jgi:hypothetical protein
MTPAPRVCWLAPRGGSCRLWAVPVVEDCQQMQKKKMLLNGWNTRCTTLVAALLGSMRAILVPSMVQAFLVCDLIIITL